MRLYHNPVSSNARRVLMVEAHLGLQMEHVVIDFGSEADRRRLSEVNINGKVPVLEDGDLLLWESAAIMQYLADKTPGHTLYPQDLKVRADVNRWMFFACQHFSPAVGVLTWENVWKKFVEGTDADPVEVARGTRELHEYAAVMDKYLANRQWFVGDHVTLADFALAAPLMYIEKGRLPVQQYKNLLAWFGRVQQLPAWQKTDVQW